MLPVDFRRGPGKSRKEEAMNTPPYLRWDESGRQQLLARAEVLLQRRRRGLLGIAGAPGAGKSTISEWLLEHLLTNHPRQVALVPMDGYHLAQSLLESRGLERRKGAPDTFDGVGYVALLRQLRSETSREIFAPVFRREVNDAIAGAIAVPPETRLIITEGNYLLLDEAPWNEVASLLDETWFVELEQGERLRRLTARHLRFDNDAAIAEWRATGNDERNARLVAAGSQRCTLVIEHTPATYSAPGRE
jgi:pantothenate kinase